MRERRAVGLLGMTGVLFLLLVGRLIGLQLVRGPRYKELARENYIKPDIIEAPRGVIYSRDGNVLADNVASWTIIIDSSKITNEEYHNIMSVLEVRHQKVRHQNEIKSEVVEGATSRGATSRGATSRGATSAGVEAPAQMRYVIRKVPFSAICEFEERKGDFPSLFIKAHPVRRYLYPEAFSHILGYTGEISKEELAETGYRFGTTVGKSGIEKSYDKFLRGRDGTRYIEVDAKGREFSLISYVSPEPGSDLYLNIDAELQLFAYEILPNMSACVAMDPRNGEILVWVSKPGIDPNLFAYGISSDVWREWKEDSLAPLWDRVLKGSFPPASIFKLVTAGAGLERKLVGRNTYQPVACRGEIIIGGRKFRCWETHGTLNLVNAIVHSCDVYFYQLGVEVGVDALMNEARKVHLADKVGVDIPGEVSGFLPSEKWYEKRYGKGGWGKGIPANLAIGQGEILTTPLQILYFVSGLANKGTLATPQIVKKAVKDGEEVFHSAPSYRNIEWSPATIEIIRAGMLGVVEGEKGTGRLARVPGIQVAGKTGTAQNPRGEDHAWFAAFAPYESPEICIVVFVENGGKGGSVAAPIAGKILQKFFGKARYYNVTLNSSTE